MSGVIREDYHAHATQFARLALAQARRWRRAYIPRDPSPRANARSSTPRCICGRQIRPTIPGSRAPQPQLPEPFTIERALPLMDEAGIDRVVIVPPGLNDVNSYALEAHKRHQDRFAVMGRIPLEDPKSAALLPDWKEQPGMLGVRVTLINPKFIAMLSDGTADWFWPAAEKAGLPVMFLAFGRVATFAPIAERHPGLPLIIDHMGANAAIAKGKEGAGGHRPCRASQSIRTSASRFRIWSSGRSIRIHSPT